MRPLTASSFFSPSLPFCPSLPLSASLPLSPSSFFSSPAFSSSLWGSTGDLSPFFSTAAYTLRRTGCCTLERSSHPAVKPKSVVAATNNSFPPLSNTGYRASPKPSVICEAFPLSREYTKIPRRWLSKNLEYVSHLLSGDHETARLTLGSSNRSLSTLTGVPFSTSTYQKFIRLSVYAIFLLSGDHVGP